MKKQAFKHDGKMLRYLKCGQTLTKLFAKRDFVKFFKKILKKIRETGLKFSKTFFANAF